MRWAGGRVDLEESVVSKRPITGRDLRDHFFADIPTLTLGLVQARGSSLYIGPIELFRFGLAAMARDRVELPIEGGLLVAAPGGHLRLQSESGRLVASVDGYAPRLPRPVYALTQLPLHRVVTRLQLLRMRGRRPAPGVPAEPSGRLAAAAIDVGLCVGLCFLAPRGRRRWALLGFVAAYHVACWSTTGRTLGGAIVKERVVATDGSRVTVGQAVLRLIALPASLLRLRAVHDEVAATEVVAE